MVLVLQIDDKENYCYSIKPTQKENKPFNLEKKVEETFEIISIDVNNAVSLINSGYPIEFEKINISEEGKNWLKLIGLRFWIKPFNNYYILPNNLKASPEILSAQLLKRGHLGPGLIISLARALAKIKKFSVRNQYPGDLKDTVVAYHLVYHILAQAHFGGLAFHEHRGLQGTVEDDYVAPVLQFVICERVFHGQMCLGIVVAPGQSLDDVLPHLLLRSKFHKLLAYGIEYLVHRAVL